MIDAELLSILCCPETKEDVSLADDGLIAKVNSQIAAGSQRNRGGQEVKESIQGGLIRADKKYLYPIREEIPIMLIDEAIPLEGLI